MILTYLLKEAKKIGSFLLRVHLIINTAKMREADDINKNKGKISKGGK